MHLDASRNGLHGIAPSIGLCKYVDQFTISVLNTGQFITFYNCAIANRSITDLSLTTNNLTELPDAIGDLSQLVVLRIDDNKLVSLPDSIGRLSNLEELQVSRFCKYAKRITCARI